MTTAKTAEQAITELEGALSNLGDSFRTFITLLESNGIKLNRRTLKLSTATPIKKIRRETPLEAAAVVLREFLAKESRSAYDCHAFLEGKGFIVNIGTTGTSGINGRRLRKEAGVRSFQQNKQWWWELEAEDVRTV